MFIINFCLNMFRASLCPSSGEQRPCYCIWCVVLVLLDVVDCGCGTLRCRMRAVQETATTNIYRSTLIKTVTHVTTNHSPLNKDANSKTSILKEKYNTRNKSTVSRKLLKMDVLTFETSLRNKASDIKLVYL